MTRRISTLYFTASLRNFGDRAVNLFSRKKKNTEQVAEAVANDIDEGADRVSKATLNLKNDAESSASSTGFFFSLLYTFHICFCFAGLLSICDITHPISSNLIEKG